jgi:hypothetical protein
MLGGVDPIFIFLFYKSPADVTQSKIPFANDLGLNRLALPPVPIYINENQTGLFIVSETKNTDIQTSMETLKEGGADVQQKGIGEVTTIKLQANKNSLGLTLLSAMSSKIVDKLTSKEYAVTYLHGAVTIFNGLLHNFVIDQNANSDKIDITIEISRGASPKTTAVNVTPVSGAASLSDGGVLQSGTTPSGSTFTPTGNAPIAVGGMP